MSQSAGNQASPVTSPSLSPAASPTRSRRGSHLTLDLSSLPPLTQPAKPTNTILITNLTNPAIFAQPHITQFRDIISQKAPLVSWSPLKSFRRIVCSFTSIEHATMVRQAIDGEFIMGDRVRVYFGEHTPVEPVDQHLAAPEFKKLFFISPPPSPPHGWEVRNEDPPNGLVIAEDLAQALAKLSWDTKKFAAQATAAEGESAETDEPSEGRVVAAVGRPRSSSSVVLFEPENDSKQAMPAISVDDYTDSGDERSPVEPGRRVIPEKASIHTARPPTELMQET